MAELRLKMQPSPDTALALFSRDNVGASSRPVVVMLHGALRSAGVLLPWVERLAEDADVMLIDLPGHGRSEAVFPASVQMFADAVLHAIRVNLSGRQVVVVGESLGGLVALAIAAQDDPEPVRAVVACDPPMTAAKLWNVAGNFRRLMAAQPDNVALKSFAFEAFGLKEASAVERNYYPLLDGLKIPVVVVTGDLPLLPPRNMQGVACLFDAVDQYIARRFYPDAIEVVEIAGCGHLLLIDAPDRCQAVIRDVLARYAAPTVG